MARNGSGTYNRAVSPYTAGTTITAATVNSEMDDIATALTASMARDGQSPATANIPMGGFRLTGLANAVASTDAAALGQVAALAGAIMTGAFGVTAGTAAAPGVFVSGDTNTGLFQPSADTLAVTVGGAEVARFGANGLQSASPWVDLASAATTNIGAQTTDNLRITGTTGISSFGTAASGVTRKLRFAAALTLTYNATSLILPGAASVVTMAGDTVTAISLGSGNWVVTDYMRALAFGGYQQIQRQTVSAVSAVDFTLHAGFRRFELRIDRGRVATAGQSLILRCGVGATFDAGASDYGRAFFTHTGATPTSGVVNDSGLDLTGGMPANDMRSSITVEIDPGGASEPFQVRSFGGVIENSTPTWRVISHFGARSANGAKDAIRILASGGANISGTFTLLGIPA